MIHGVVYQIVYCSISFTFVSMTLQSFMDVALQYSLTRYHFYVHISIPLHVLLIYIYRSKKASYQYLHVCPFYSLNKRQKTLRNYPKWTKTFTIFVKRIFFIRQLLMHRKIHYEKRRAQCNITLKSTVLFELCFPYLSTKFTFTCLLVSCSLLQNIVCKYI